MASHWLTCLWIAGSKVLYVTMKAGSLAGSHVRRGWDGSPGVTWNSRCPSLERSLGEYSFSPWRCSVVADAWKPGDLEAVSLKKTGCLVRKVVKCDQKEEVIWISGPFIGRSSWPSIIDFFGVFPILRPVVECLLPMVTCTPLHDMSAMSTPWINRLWMEWVPSLDGKFHQVTVYVRHPDFYTLSEWSLDTILPEKHPFKSPMVLRLWFIGIS